MTRMGGGSRGGGLSRRGVLAGAAGGVVALAVGTGVVIRSWGSQRGEPTVAPPLRERVERMASYGPRFTGSPAHRRWIDDVERQLRGSGLDVKRYAAPLAYWNATSWALTVTDVVGRKQDLPVAYYWPHSGSTPAGGVTGRLMDTGAGAEASYHGLDIAGAIVVTDHSIPKITLGDFAGLASKARPPSLLQDSGAEDYTRMWLADAPSLKLAKGRGAIGMIGILDLAPDDANGMYSPHRQSRDELPAVQLDREQGKRLRELMKQGPLTATLTLTADTDDRASIDYLTATLPGNGTKYGAIMIMTHTDGQNAVEENGGAAVLAMVEHFARTPQSGRDRDIIVVFYPAHMAAPGATVSFGGWLKDNPEIPRRVVAAVVPEHLGTMQWTSSGADPARPTGQPELLLLGVGNSDQLTRVVGDALDTSDLVRTAVVAPRSDGLYGVATGPYRAGIPTVTAISGPVYLLQVSPGNELDKLDFALMDRQTRFLTGLTEQLLNASWLPMPWSRPSPPK